MKESNLANFIENFATLTFSKSRTYCTDSVYHSTSFIYYASSFVYLYNSHICLGQAVNSTGNRCDVLRVLPVRVGR